MKMIFYLLKSTTGVFVAANRLNEDPLLADLSGLSDNLDSFHYLGAAHDRHNLRMDNLRVLGDLRKAAAMVNL